MDFLADARTWARGRSWIPRAILLAYLVWCDWRLLRDPDSSTIFAGITLAFHEMGHLLTAFLPHLICAAAGSGMQLLIPIVVIIIFRRQDDYFGMAVGGFWLSFSAFDVARYVADARSMDLPLVGFSPDPEHDWNFILGTLHMLPADHFLAFVLRVAAMLVGIGSLTFAVWLLNEMRKPAVVAHIAVPRTFPPRPSALRDTTAAVSDAARKWDDLTTRD
jgi:hypothetical protein